MQASGIITLLTDFGSRDAYVGIMKGVALGICPAARLVDLTHEVPPQAVRVGALLLRSALGYFPDGTVHLAVVDPGVGSARNPVAVLGERAILVGPDNGLLAPAATALGSYVVRRLTCQQLFRRPVSATFHGRDLFAPVAAYVDGGTSLEEIGAEIEDYVRFEIPRPRSVETRGVIEGRIIHIDRFGNCVTNFTEAELKPDEITPSTKLHIAGREVRRFGAYFAEATDRDDLFAYPGSAGFWEIALWRRSAAEFINARRGDEVILVKKGSGE